MKNVFKLFVILLATSFFFASCTSDDDKDDDNTDTTGNYFMVGSTKYDLSTGYLVYYGKWSTEGDYNFDIELYSDDYSIVDGDLVGTGDYVYFELFTTTGEDLDLGAYTYDPNYTEAAGTFDYGEVGINYNWETEDGTYQSFASGTLTVTATGDTYTFAFTGNDDDISIQWSGALTYLDYSEDKKSSSSKADIRKARLAHP